MIRRNRRGAATLDHGGDTGSTYGAESAAGVEQAATGAETSVQMNTQGKHLRDPEDRVIDECSDEQRKEKMMDKTLADSFPASDPPGWEPNEAVPKIVK